VVIQGRLLAAVTEAAFVASNSHNFLSASGNITGTFKAPHWQAHQFAHSGIEIIMG
jgi:hypothetical protein